MKVFTKDGLTVSYDDTQVVISVEQEQRKGRGYQAHVEPLTVTIPRDHNTLRLLAAALVSIPGVSDGHIHVDLPADADLDDDEDLMPHDEEADMVGLMALPHIGESRAQQLVELGVRLPADLVERGAEWLALHLEVNIDQADEVIAAIPV